MGDLAGFAAAVHLRGIACLQIPTTLLAMIDSSVGGKTGINTSYGKNLVGAFHQPAGVLIDVATLVSLPRRELTAGLCEAIKHAAISGAPLLKQTRAYLEGWPGKALGQDPEQRTHLARLVAANVRFKAKIVQNDEIEAVTDNSPQSRKILNFGHTFAHALEKVTDYKYLKHGEAVGHGIRFAAALSKRLELIDQNEVELLNDVLRSAGVLPAISHIDPLKVMEAFKHDKKKVGESLNWILLRGIGKPVIVSGSDSPRSAITTTLKDIIRE